MRAHPHRPVKGGFHPLSVHSINNPAPLSPLPSLLLRLLLSSPFFRFLLISFHQLFSHFLPLPLFCHFIFTRLSPLFSFAFPFRSTSLKSSTGPSSLLFLTSLSHHLFLSHFFSPLHSISLARLSSFPFIFLKKSSTLCFFFCPLFLWAHARCTLPPSLRLPSPVILCVLSL